MINDLVNRSLTRVKALMGRNEGPRSLADKDIPALLRQLQECADGMGGEVSARQRAARLAHTYLSLNEGGRRAMLRLIATEFGPDPARVAAAHAAWQAAIQTADPWQAEAELRGALRSRRTRILTQFNAIPQGVKFLVDLRADLLRFARQDPALAALDQELEVRLSSWFDVGFLELARITWQSPAAMLEKLIEYEAVHTIQSWADLKNRLDLDRRCYAFFHPRMPLEPLIFVEVALVDTLAGNVQALLDEAAPVFEASRASTAIFYSINNTQTGLRGVSFGNFLLKRVIDDLKRDFPRLSTFATLSPSPGWWLGPPATRRPSPPVLPKPTGSASGRGTWLVRNRPCSRSCWPGPATGPATRPWPGPCATPSSTWPPATCWKPAGMTSRPIRWPASTSATAPASNASTGWGTPRRRAWPNPGG